MEALEHIKAPIRAKVAQLFHILKNLLKHKGTRYQDMTKNTAQLLTLLDLANLMLAKRRLMIIHASNSS